PIHAAAPLGRGVSRSDQRSVAALARAHRRDQPPASRGGAARRRNPAAPDRLWQARTDRLFGLWPARGIRLWAAAGRGLGRSADRGLYRDFRDAEPVAPRRRLA